MTASMRGQASRGEATTPAARNVCSLTNGHGECSRSRTPVRQHARRAEHPIDASRSTTATAGQRSIQTSHSAPGCVTPATSKLSDQEELKSLLLEGWGKGWLAFNRPACACAKTRPEGGGAHFSQTKP